MSNENQNAKNNRRSKKPEITSNAKTRHIFKYMLDHAAEETKRRLNLPDVGDARLATK